VTVNTNTQLIRDCVKYNELHAAESLLRNWVAYSFRS